MEKEQPTTDRIWISVGLAVLGLCLVGASMFVTDDPAHVMLTGLIQIIMIVSGSVCVFLSVVLYFVRNSPDLHS